MKIVAIIPSRYDSSRFPGKGLADICGKPMIWWIYNQISAVKEINDVYVATDDDRIRKACEAEGMNVVMTSTECPTHLERLYEASKIVDADFYINVNGDESLIEASCISDLLPHDINPSDSYVANGMMVLNDPIDAFDTSKIKIATDMNGYGMYMSRSPIPFPKGRSDYHLLKFVGVQCFTKRALEFVNHTPRGYLKSIEDIDEYRFLENGHKVKFVMTNATTLLVDTRKDLEKVRAILKKRIDEGTIATKKLF